MNIKTRKIRFASEREVEAAMAEIKKDILYTRGEKYDSTEVNFANEELIAIHET